MEEIINYLIKRDHNTYSETANELMYVISLIYEAIELDQPRCVLEDILMEELCLEPDFLLIIINK